MSDLIKMTRGEGYRILALNRPEKLNSFTEDLHRALKASIDDADADTSCRALILTGEGRGFCAGQDLGDRSEAMKAGGPITSTLEAHYNPLVRRIRSLRMPVICAVNGIAAGAGANLALGCDIVVAARSAKFLQAFAKIGLLPDAGGTWVLPRLAGPARARGLALLAEPISAEQAEAWGMIWKVVDDAQLMPEVTAMATRLASGPTHAFATIKRALDRAETNTLDQQLDLERDLQGELLNQHDFKEGVAAFFEKRSPKFRGTT
jgi:2-(1,2-epoxy-1,2-dihydrophenyl)acetyl-CoA isomerase